MQLDADVVARGLRGVKLRAAIGELKRARRGQSTRPVPKNQAILVTTSACQRRHRQSATRKEAQRVLRQTQILEPKDQSILTDILHEVAGARKEVPGKEAEAVGIANEIGPE